MTNEKARVALSKIEGVSFALISSGTVEILLSGDSYDEKAVKSTLESSKFAVSAMEKMTELPF